MMNNTPRKKLGYRTPKEVFNELYKVDCFVKTEILGG